MRFNQELGRYAYMADAYSSSISFAMPRSSSIWFFKKLANISTSFSFNRRALFRIKMTLHFVCCTVSHFVIIDYLTRCAIHFAFQGLLETGRASLDFWQARPRERCISVIFENKYPRVSRNGS